MDDYGSYVDLGGYDDMWYEPGGSGLLDYSFELPSSGSSYGLQMPDLPNREDMGGGQGISIDTGDLADINPFWSGLPDGTLAQGGIYTDDWRPSLGDPSSFINNQNTSANRPVDGAGRPIGGTAAGAGGLAQGIKDLLGNDWGKLLASLLGAGLIAKNDKGDSRNTGFSALDMNRQMVRSQKPQDPNRRPGSANPGGYFTPTQFKAMGGPLRPSGIGTLIKGPTNGMADQRAAVLGGVEDIAVSDGEFIVPADVVADLGGGNNEAGAARLEEMLARVRQQAHGTKKQTRPVPDSVLRT
jgi:hypothetical protein